MTRTAVVADIHGNRWALEAVLEDARRESATLLLNLGDVLYGPLDPEGTAQRLMALALPSLTVLGNEDRVLLEPPEDSGPHTSLRFTLSQLSAPALDWLRAAPAVAEREGVFLMHGTPAADDEYLLEEVLETGARQRRPEAVARLLAGVDARMIACGHSHLARLVRLPDGRTVLNPGSVGLPAYTDDLPHPHTMEAGSPLARYAIIEQDHRGWLVAERAVPYDWQAAARVAEQNGRPDWAEAIRTGWIGRIRQQD